MKVVYISNGAIGTPLNYRGFMPQHGGAMLQVGSLVAEISFETKEVFCYFKVNNRGIIVASTNGTKLKLRAMTAEDSKNLPEAISHSLAKKYVEELYSAVVDLDFFNKKNVEKFLHFTQAQGA